MYDAFDLARGSAAQLFGPGVLWSALKSALKGHGVGRPVGNPMRLSGWFLVDDGSIVWSHVHEDAGAQRRWGELASAYEAAAAT